MKVVIVGGSGYLGQHLLQSFNDEDGGYDVAYTHHNCPLPPLFLSAFSRFHAFPVDLRSGHGFDSLSHHFGQPDVVVNCAALSIPRACEQDPDSAMSINVPFSLIDWLSTSYRTLLIHLSTDQVYQGVKSFYKEEDETVAVNVYGKSKVEAENLIKEKCRNFAILRSSIIIGPQTVSPLPKNLPLEWIDRSLRKGVPVEFFHDEYRCPIYVKDLVSIILKLIQRWADDDKKEGMRVVLNAGGGERVSRVEMAEAVAQARGHDLTLIKQVSASSSLSSPSPSPADISMDITKLIETLDMTPTCFKEAVRLTLHDSD
ncbi:unnamed protein product [Cochlearia groenlandica]